MGMPHDRGRCLAKNNLKIIMVMINDYDYYGDRARRREISCKKDDGGADEDDYGDNDYHYYEDYDDDGVCSLMMPLTKEGRRKLSYKEQSQIMIPRGAPGSQGLLLAFNEFQNVLLLRDVAY